MNAYEAYVLYLALKRHFTNDKYDFLQYNGRVSASRDAFERRNDKYAFGRLAKKEDPKGFLIANFICNTSTWIGDLVDNEEYEQIYTKWKRRSHAIEYNLSIEIDKLDDDIESMIRTSGNYPRLFEQYMWGGVSSESMIAMNSILRFLPYWNKHINDTVVYPEYARRLRKYRPFVRFDQGRVKQIMKERWLHNEHNT